MLPTQYKKVNNTSINGFCPHYCGFVVWAGLREVDADRVSSTLLNRVIAGNAPSHYLAKLEKKAGMKPQRMAEILESHVIDSEALRDDDFDSFLEARTVRCWRESKRLWENQ
jgi:hypothetical protein